MNQKSPEAPVRCNKYDLFISFYCFFLKPFADTNSACCCTQKRGWIAQPRKERWHKKPTALSGGIAIYLAAAIPLFYFADFKSLIPHLALGTIHPELPDLAAVIFLGMTFIFILGLLDDFIHIKPHTKLVGQILVASMVAFLGFRLHWFVSLTGDTIITIFWIVGITNAFNLIDNMDGLCAGVGFIAACYLALLFNQTFPMPI
jgi:UDP-GlcNAc:undecaprenyl-phosphate/decaprenyl-phosphate GlcNAc-1-phosphate transferase